jgi:GTP-binding protein
MSSVYARARYISSAYKIDQLVDDEGIEIAFAGRSNAGKSTAINRLTRQKNLCKTSKTPGRTQLINFFEVADQRRLVDLPGYGFAKVPKKMRQHWDHVLSAYLLERSSLHGLIIVVDIRRGISDMDLGLIELVDEQLPIHLLLAKADKLKSGARKKVLQETLNMVAADGISASCFSALSGLGLEEFEQCCDNFLELA